MSNKWSTGRGTHVPLPWCLSPPPPKGPRLTPFPATLKIQVIFRACPPDGIAADLSFFFASYPFMAGAPGSDTAFTGGFKCVVEILRDRLQKHMIAGASISRGSETWGILQDTTAVAAIGNPIAQEWSTFVGTVPDGQVGSIKCWE
jgi:hypothetical protein